MSISRIRTGGVVLAAVAALALSACGSSSDAAGTSASADGPIPVVTSSNVWGDVVAQIGGDQVQVTPLITDPAADPHSFEPNAQAQLAVSKAALLVENGGGYDPYLDTMVQASGTAVPLINAVELSGLDAEHAVESSGADSSADHADDGHEHAEFNEHVWYDFPTGGKVAAKVADELSAIRPEQAAFFQANLTAFTDGLAGLTAKVDAIKAAHANTPVAITEPVPLYLTDAAGLVNKTPDAFSAAIEEGTDVPPAVQADTLALFTGRQVVLLVYNEQTSSPETEAVQAAAKDNAIAVVGVTETLPEGKDYLSWMDSNVTALAAALDG